MGKRDIGSDQTASGNEQLKNGSTSTGSTATGRGGTGRGRTATGSTAKEKSPSMVLVDLPKSEDEKAAEKKAAAAERQRKSRANKKAQATSSKKTVAVASNTQMKVMLMTLSGILASRPGMEVWALSPEEADQIVTPLSGIMAKSNIGESVGEYADHIALAIACFTIFIPKFLMWQQTKPKKEEVKYDKVRNSQGSSTDKARTTETSSGSSNRQHTDNLSNVSPSISQLIPASAGI